MSMVKVKASELTGEALDWAVAKALRFTAKKSAYGTYYWHCEEFHQPYWYNGPMESYKPSTDWNQGGPLMALISGLKRKFGGWEVKVHTDGGEFLGEGRGETQLIAVCRAIVASTLGRYGREVEVPHELVGVDCD